MATNTSNDYVNKLQDLEFFQGDTFTIPFQFVHGEDNTPIDLSLHKVKISFCPYGRYNQPILIKYGVISTDKDRKGMVLVDFVKADTEKINFYKLNYQPIIEATVSLGSQGEERIDEYRRGQANLTLKPRIG